MLLLPQLCEPGNLYLRAFCKFASSKLLLRLLALGTYDSLQGIHAHWWPLLLTESVEPATGPAGLVDTCLGRDQLFRSMGSQQARC